MSITIRPAKSNIGNLKKMAIEKKIVLVWGLALVTALWFAMPGRCESMGKKQERNIVELPEPLYDGKVSLEQTLGQRRSIRRFAKEGLTLAAISRLLWAAQGVTDPRGFRTAPSAGALYPLELYVVAGKTEDLSPGIYRYLPGTHGLETVIQGEMREALCDAALGQDPVREAPALFVFTAVFPRITGRYGDRGIRYAHMEAGHAAQNIALQAVSLGLGTVMIGAFDDDRIKRLMNLGDDEYPLYLIPTGNPVK